ncbi:MAG: Stp1/IreP family PP2C-type Ser/Thr phosphatase [Oscillospiraceae bacterium]|nr:Stp1/IreP family PP2C-type Ser/Thr phosphatase [Oscillospiraceae bacterium]
MRYWALTDTGRVRSENQDSWLVRSTETPEGKEILTAVVCDGMGGAKAGNVASRMGVERFTEYLCPGLETVEQAELSAPLAVREANRAIYDLAFAVPEYEGMGTTLVAAVTDGRETRIVNIGDSRCYLVRNKVIRQITKDHSLVQDLVDRGEIDRADAWLHPQRNYITRALGTDEDVICDVFREELEPGDILLLCSDGLSGIVNSQELLFEIAYGGELETAADRMMGIALERGAPDNVTLILLSADGPEAEG